MNRTEAMAMLREALAARFDVPADQIDVEWDGVTKPRVRLPARLDNIETFSERVMMFEAVLKETLGEIMEKITDTRHLSDEALAARLKARRNA